MYVVEQTIVNNELRVTAIHNGTKIIVNAKAASWEKTKLPRLFVYGEEDVDFSDLYAIEGWPSDKRLTPEFNRRNRQVIANKHTLAKSVLGALADMGIHLDRMRFSRTAGCSCGCSPAFITNGVTIKLLGKEYALTDIFVERT